MREVVVGVDFGGPALASAQRRKILAVEARRISASGYAIKPGGLNARLLQDPPGWTALELADAIAASAVPVRILAADFPFSIPSALLADPSFAGRGDGVPFATWAGFNRAIAAGLPLSCPVDYRPFARWRDKALWLKRECDRESGAQPPLKHFFQVCFNMTLLGNAFLARLDQSGLFDVVPFQARGRPAQAIEVYPGHMMRKLGVRDYKRAPRRAIDAALGFLGEGGIAVELDPALRAVCESYDTGRKGSHDFDAADALVAACIAILHREGRARETMPAGAVRHQEGAIWSV